ncbi:MAG: hypothetical protein FJ027_04760 [Candidatus Rokubacteria bacterium]|nr:hypothetical protein [Candidatus Rokubacteria bacterium]
MRVLAIRRRLPADERDVTLLPPAALADVLAQADHVATTLPLTSETRGVIGARELRLMKPGALLLNPARAESRRGRAVRGACDPADRRRGAGADAWPGESRR